MTLEGEERRMHNATSEGLLRLLREWKQSCERCESREKNPVWSTPPAYGTPESIHRMKDQKARAAATQSKLDAAAAATAQLKKAAVAAAEDDGAVVALMSPKVSAAAAPPQAP